MNKEINIGTKINLEDLLLSRLLIQANSGGGKSVLARIIIEEVFGKVPFIIMDIEGEYYTLKEKFGDILIIGGQHADIPISLKSAALLPKEIIGNRLNVVIDMSDLKMNDRILYSKYFIEAMMDLPQQYWVNYFAFIEESHKLCGEQDKQASASAIKDLMSRGRKRGYCGVLITQRISKLHKDAAAECNNKFIGRTTLDIDIDRAAKELGFTAKTDKNILRDLKPGNFYAFGTAITPHHVHVVKINMPKTKIPKAGTDLDIKPKPPTDKIKQMLVKLNTLNEPKLVNSNIHPGSQIHTAKQTDIITTKPVQTFEKEYKASVKINEELRQFNTEIMDKLKEKDKELKEKEKQLTEFKKVNETAISILNKVNMTEIKPVEIRLYPKKTVAGSSENQKAEPLVRNVYIQEQPPSTELNKCPRTILEFLGSFPDKSFSKAQISVGSCYSSTSGGFKNALSELTTKGFILKAGSKIQVSKNGMHVLGDNFKTKQYSAQAFTNNLSKCEREIYQVLLDDPESVFSKEQLADSTVTKYSVTSGGFKNAISRLNTLELIERSSGGIKLNPELLELM